MRKGEKMNKINKRDIDDCVRGIDISWMTWGKMPGENMTLGDINYLKSENDKGFERIFAVNIERDIDFSVRQMISSIKKGILPDSILITPNTKPSNLADILYHKGFLINDSNPCMLLRMEDFQPNFDQSVDLQIIDVTNKKQLSDWLNIVNEALFGCKLVTLEQFNDILSLDTVRLYLGLVKHKPVCICMTIVEGDSSVLEMVATLKNHRRKGYATKLISKAILNLKQLGIKTISLRAEADGVSVYKQLGFYECFKRILATYDWERLRHISCPCHMEDKVILKAKEIFETSIDIEDFVHEMKNQHVIGRDIRYDKLENAIYITKMYACDCGGGCTENKNLIGERCHYNSYHYSREYKPKYYCQCGAEFYRPMFAPIFDNDVCIEPYETVLSGDDECIIIIRIDEQRI